MAPLRQGGDKPLYSKLSPPSAPHGENVSGKNDLVKLRREPDKQQPQCMCMCGILIDYITEV